MIHEYAAKLIENIPCTIKNNKTIKTDLVLDGGIFNGSYLAGALYFLKEMEKKNIINVERVSGVSVGAIVAFLYFIDELDLMTHLYNIVCSEFKTNYNLKIIKKLKTLLNCKIPSNICEKVNERLYITYYNIKKGKKIVKKKYKSIDDILNTIIKSCFIPYLIDGTLLYKNKYIDGINPYIFNIEKDKKILYLDLCGYDKIWHLLNIKNEKTNHHRILSGLLDIHNFYIKQASTNMCSYVNDWSIINNTTYYFKKMIEKIFVYIVYIIMYLKKYIPIEIQHGVIYKIISKMFIETFIILLDTYCM